MWLDLQDDWFDIMKKKGGEDMLLCRMSACVTPITPVGDTFHEIIIPDNADDIITYEELQSMYKYIEGIGSIE